jgi:hypothetical protein
METLRHKVGGADTRTCVLDRMLLMHDYLTAHRRLSGDRNRMIFRITYTRAQYSITNMQLETSPPMEFEWSGFLLASYLPGRFRR